MGGADRPAEVAESTWSDRLTRFGAAPMMTNLRSLRAMGTWSLVLRLATLGAFAGFAAWAVVWAAHLVFEFGRPSTIALVLAIPRGAIVGVVLALIVRAYWNRTHGQHDSKETL